MILDNGKIKLEFNERGNLVGLAGTEGQVSIPIDRQIQTAPFEIELRDASGKIVKIQPDQPPRMKLKPVKNGQALVCEWTLAGPGGQLQVTGRVALADASPLSEWTLAIENQTPHALWQIAYPRVSGLTAFQGRPGPDWICEPAGMGEKTPNPVDFVNHHEKVVSNWSRQQYGCFDVECGKADIAYSYPGMWTLQFLGYGHPSCGGIYFGAHDGQALYKKFGLYADGGDGRHAALVMKQYPKDRTATGGVFKSFYPAMVGVYRGDWWGAAALYREWALGQEWCRKGPTKDRADIPAWTKKLDLWYWNWQFISAGGPQYVVPAIKHLKEKFGAEMAFHWYGFSGYASWFEYYRFPEVYPDNAEIREALVAGVRELHQTGVHCIPYINARLWNETSASFRKMNAMRWVAVDEHGKSADLWPDLGHTICPTERPFQRFIRRLTNQMIDKCEMDGAYLDQPSSCYAVPCFNKDHDHAPGGHDHWCRGYRQMMKAVQRDIKKRSPDNIITSESVIECYLDLFDLDLAREISSLEGHVGSPASLPIPMFHSIYHDYHLTYGTVMTFKQTEMAHFRYAEALCLVGGGQLMVSGLFDKDWTKEKFQPHLRYMEMLTRAHIAGRKWLNLGVWKPPLAIAGDRVAVPFSSVHPPKADIPAVVNGCFELDGELCLVFVNHTDQPRTGTFELSPAAYGLKGSSVDLWQIHPGTEIRRAQGVAGAVKQALTLAPMSAQVLVVKAAG